MDDPTPVPPVVVTLPAEIDVTSADEVAALIRAAFRPGARTIERR